MRYSSRYIENQGSSQENEMFPIPREALWLVKLVSKN